MIQPERLRRPLPLLLAAALLACVPGEEAPPDGTAERTTPPDVAAPQDTLLLVEDAGLAGPESALHDPGADVYLVSNINGESAAEDGNGFVSRVTPEGRVAELKWIDGASDSVTLNAPKGLALKGDTLLVADIDVVRLFHRTTGRPLGEWPVAGAAFLNDVAVGEDGTVYVTDTGFLSTSEGVEGTNADAVYRFDAAGAPGLLASGRELQAPNGIVVDGAGVVIVPWNDAHLRRLSGGAAPAAFAEVPGAQLDGVVRLPDGSFVVSSWVGEAIYRVDASGRASTLFEGVASPADIGYDERRHRLLIPQLGEDRLQIRPLPR